MQKVKAFGNFFYDNIKDNFVEKPPIFGSKLDVRSSDVPSIIIKFVEYLDKRLDTEGLFRISANKNVVSSFRERIDKGEEFDFEKEIDDPHIIASLLKAYFVELQDPLINYEWYHLAIAVVGLDCADKSIELIRKIITQLPPGHLVVLEYLIGFLCRVCKHEEVNKMNPQNLSIIFAPTLLRNENDDLRVSIEDSPSASKLIQLFIIHYNSLFSDYQSHVQSGQAKFKSIERPSVINRTSSALKKEPLIIKPSQDQIFAACIKKGYLTKMGYVVKSWKSRLFVLTADNLFYFKDFSNHHRIPISSFVSISNLSLDQLQEGKPPQTLQDHFFFGIETRNRKYILAADTEEERKNWVALLQVTFTNKRETIMSHLEKVREEDNT